MAVVGALNLLFKADTTNAKKGINDLRTTFTSSWGAMAGKIGMITGLIGGLTSGAFVSLAVKVGKANREINKNAEAMGISYKRMKAFEDVLGVYGVSAQTTHMAITKVSKAVGDAANGSVSFENALNKLGLKSKDLIDLKADEQFFRVSKGLSEMKNQSERTSVTMVLLGESAMGMSGALDRVSGSFEDLVKSSESSMSLLTDQQRASIEVMTQKWEVLGQTTGGFFDKLIGVGSPALSKFFDYFTQFTDYATTKVEGLTLAALTMYDVWGKFSKFLVSGASVKAMFGLYNPADMINEIKDSYKEAKLFMKPGKEVADEIKIAEDRLKTIKEDASNTALDSAITSTKQSTPAGGSIDAKNIKFGASVDVVQIEKQSEIMTKQLFYTQIIAETLQKQLFEQQFLAVK